MATLKSNIPGLIGEMRARASRHVRATAAAIEGDIKTGMGESKSGRKYKRGEKQHTASAPGESPAIDHGDYVKTIQAVPVDDTTSAVGTADERGPVLELGGVKTEARPHFGPAFERAREEFEQGAREIFEG